MPKLEVVFIQGSSLISKTISKVSKFFVRNDYHGKFYPSHVFLVLDDSIIFESSTYKKAGQEDEKVLEKGTRVLLVNDRANEIKDNIIERTIIDNDVDSLIALKYIAKASNYKYSYSSIFRFLTKGRFKKEKRLKKHDEYICSGLVIDALREPYFKNNKAIQRVVEMFKGIDSNTVTPLDLFLAMDKAGYTFKNCKGLSNAICHL